MLGLPPFFPSQGGLFFCDAFFTLDRTLIGFLQQPFRPGESPDRTQQQDGLWSRRARGCGTVRESFALGTIAVWEAAGEAFRGTRGTDAGQEQFGQGCRTGSDRGGLGV